MAYIGVLAGKSRPFAARREHSSVIERSSTRSSSTAALAVRTCKNSEKYGRCRANISMVAEKGRQIEEVVPRELAIEVRQLKFGGKRKYQGTELYSELLNIYVMQKNGAKKQNKEKSMWEKFDDACWEMFQGKKEKKWSVDQRPEEERGVFDITKTNLSWGRWDPFDPEEGEFARGQSENPCMSANPPEYCSIEDFDYMSEEDNKDELTLSFAENMQRVSDYAEVPRELEDRQLSGMELAELCWAKYGYYHDISMLQAQPFGEEDRQVAVCVYGPFLGMKDFPMTESQYIEKLDALCARLMAFDQAWFVRNFFLQPVYPRRGLPSTPKADTSITLRLNESPTWKYVPKSLVDQFFAY